MGVDKKARYIDCVYIYYLQSRIKDASHIIKNKLVNHRILTVYSTPKFHAVSPKGKLL